MNTIFKHLGVRSFELLSKQDSAEVFKVRLESGDAVLKLFRDEFNFRREECSLNLFKDKKFPVPDIYASGLGIEFNIGFPYYILEECLPGIVLKEVFSSFEYQKKCSIIKKCGELLGRINTVFSKNELKESGLWKYTYDGVIDYHQYTWIDFHIRHMPQWLANIQIENDPGINYKQISEVIIQSLRKADEKATIRDTNMGFLHRDYGFRNILMSGEDDFYVIDFEYGLIGDIFYDLSKLIFNDLCFESDVDLRVEFFGGWEKTAKRHVSMSQLWLYLALQGLGAIQWVDKQKDETVRGRNQDYRDKGKKVLMEAYEIIANEVE